MIRLPRHGASCPIGIGVSCSADRNVKCKINREGLWIEKLDDKPAELIPEEFRNMEEGETVKIDLNQPMEKIRAELSKHPVSTRVSLTGKIIVARDIAHAKLQERLDKGEPLPQYIKDHPVLYAGPAKTPEGYACGSMGPTTANRMDLYADPFMAAGGSHVMIAKGNRTDVVTEACKKHGGFYLARSAVLLPTCPLSPSAASSALSILSSVWKLFTKLTLLTSLHSSWLMTRAMTSLNS